MSTAPQLQPVLDRIDADFDNSLERLFALLRIKSISADPAFAGDCKAAADHLARDIATLGFATDVRPTAGHPAIVAKINGDSVKYLKTDELRTRYQRNGADPAPTTPAEFYKLMADEQQRVKTIIRNIGLKPQF